MSCISWIRTRETNVPTHLQGELQMEGFPFVVSDSLEYRLRTNAIYGNITVTGMDRTYHELVPNLDTLLERTFPPSCLGNDSILELDIELRFVRVCPGYIRFLAMRNDGGLCLYVGHEYEKAVDAIAILRVWPYTELCRYLILPTPVYTPLRWRALRVDDKDARQVQIKCNILYFVPTTRLGKEGLQNVHL